MPIVGKVVGVLTCAVVTSATLVVTGALLVVTMFATRNKCIASSNKCLTSSNKKLLETSALLVVGVLTCAPMQMGSPQRPTTWLGHVSRFPEEFPGGLPPTNLRAPPTFKVNTSCHLMNTLMLSDVCWLPCWHAAVGESGLGNCFEIC